MIIWKYYAQIFIIKIAYHWLQPDVQQPIIQNTKPSKTHHKKVKSLSGSIKSWYHSICVGRICDIELEARVVTGKDSA